MRKKNIRKDESAKMREYKRRKEGSIKKQKKLKEKRKWA